jgi:multidrug efflux pump subunit AcrB
LPATQVAISDPPTIEGLGDFLPIMMRVVGPDLRELNRHAQFIAGALKANGGTADVRVEANAPKPEMAIAVIGGVITSTALMLLVVPVIFAGVEKLSFARLFRRSRLQTPILVSAEPPSEAAPARVVNG